MIPGISEILVISEISVPVVLVWMVMEIRRIRDRIDSLPCQVKK